MTAKPKLAPGSRWKKNVVVSTNDMRYDVDNLVGSEPVLFLEHGGVSMHGNLDNILAAIRAAKLDPVFDASVKLAEYWDSLPSDGRDRLGNGPFGKLLDANSAAVKGATSDDES